MSGLRMKWQKARESEKGDGTSAEFISILCLVCIDQKIQIWWARNGAVSPLTYISWLCEIFSREDHCEKFLLCSRENTYEEKHKWIKKSEVSGTAAILVLSVRCDVEYYYNINRKHVYIVYDYDINRKHIYNVGFCKNVVDNRFV